MPCVNFSALNIPECVEEIKINAYLSPNTEYLYSVTGDSKAVYSRLATTDAGGSFTIITSLFPLGYFNKGRGLFYLRVTDPETNCSNMLMEICEEITDTLILGFVKSDATPQIIEIEIG